MKLREVVQSLFPSGYLSYSGFPDRGNDRENERPKTRGPIGELPYLCTDLFAIAATLMQRSGAYHHVIPENSSVHGGRALVVDHTMRERWKQLAASWRGDEADDVPEPPKELITLWHSLWQHRDSDVYVSLKETERPPTWWMLALDLMCIADEAAVGLGFDPPAGKKGSFQVRLLEASTKRSLKFSYSVADTDVACISPKSRSPMLGCTLRSLSHHLALLPPRGLARAYWHPMSEVRSSQPTEPKAFNCLLVPLPYKIRAKAFRGRRNKGEKWGWFHLSPDWCSESSSQRDRGFQNFWQFVSSLIKEAEQDVSEVHAVVFPESALSSTIFRKLADKLAATNVELLVSGLHDLSGLEKGRTRGNFAALAAIGKDGIKTYREKHHRWRLDRSQIQTYALGSSLDPNFGWWEDIAIHSRSLDVMVLRGTTTVTTLICEDLARSDPCQELVRGIGPNIVFALLMDGPQLKARWPARYATVLAEDPGSSVLSFTSLGLVERSNATGQLSACRNIGLWRDDRGETVELTLPVGFHALCLALNSTSFDGRTLDGRHDDHTSESWRLTGIQPVKASCNNEILAKVLQGDWPAA